MATCWIFLDGKVSARAREIKDAHDICYDFCGVLTSHRVETGHTVNGMYYKGCIQKVLQPAIHRKRPELLAAGPIILHDNAAPHVFGGWRHYSRATNGKHCPILLILQTSIHVTSNFSPRLKENMQEVRFEDLGKKMPWPSRYGCMSAVA